MSPAGVCLLLSFLSLHQMRVWSRKSPATHPGGLWDFSRADLTRQSRFKSGVPGFAGVKKRTDFELIGRTKLSRQTAEMKFVALLLLPIAASSGSSSGGSLQEQVSLAAGDLPTKKVTVARALRAGRQKRRPCAKSIATCDCGV